MIFVLFSCQDNSIKDNGNKTQGEITIQDFNGVWQFTIYPDTTKKNSSNEPYPLFSRIAINQSSTSINLQPEPEDFEPGKYEGPYWFDGIYPENIVINTADNAVGFEYEEKFDGLIYLYILTLKLTDNTQCQGELRTAGTKFIDIVQGVKIINL